MLDAKRIMIYPRLCFMGVINYPQTVGTEVPHLPPAPVKVPRLRLRRLVTKVHLVLFVWEDSVGQEKLLAATANSHAQC